MPSLIAIGLTFVGGMAEGVTISAKLVEDAGSMVYDGADAECYGPASCASFTTLLVTPDVLEYPTHAALSPDAQIHYTYVRNYHPSWGFVPSVLATDTATGDTLWTYERSTGDGDFPQYLLVGSDGTVYIGQRQSTADEPFAVVAVDGETGTEKWAWSPDEYYSASLRGLFLRPGGELVVAYAGVTEGEGGTFADAYEAIKILDPDGPRVVWSFEALLFTPGLTSGSSFAYATLLDPSGESLYVSTQTFSSDDRQTVVLARSLADGSLLWSQPTPDFAVLQGAGPGFLAYDVWGLNVVRANDGTILWEDRYVYDGAVVSKDGAQVFFTKRLPEDYPFHDAYLVAVDPLTGAEEWRRQVPASDWTGAAAVGSWLFAHSQGTLRVFDRWTGESLWFDEFPGWNTRLAASGEGSFVTAVSSGPDAEYDIRVQGWEAVREFDLLVEAKCHVLTGSSQPRCSVSGPD